MRHSREAVRFAEQTGNLQLVRAMKSYLMYATWFAGETAEPRHLAEELIGGPILTAAERAAGGTAYDPRLAGLQVRGHVRFYQGDFDGGEADIRRGIELAREVGDHWAESTCAAYLVVFGDLRGERDSVLDDARTSVEAAERLSGDVGQQTSARLYLGLAHVLRREWYQARSVLEECLAFRRDTGVSLWQESDTLRYLACALHGAQEPERAVALAREAAQLRGAPVWSSIDKPLHASARPRAEIERALDSVAQLIRQHGFRSFAGFEREERARMAHLLGDDVAHERELREAHRLYTEMGAAGHAERVGRELGLN